MRLNCALGSRHHGPPIEPAVRASMLSGVTTDTITYPVPRPIFRTVSRLCPCVPLRCFTSLHSATTSCDALHQGLLPIQLPTSCHVMSCRVEPQGYSACAGAPPAPAAFPLLPRHLSLQYLSVKETRSNNRGYGLCMSFAAVAHSFLDYSLQTGVWPSSTHIRQRPACLPGNGLHTRKAHGSPDFVPAVLPLLAPVCMLLLAW